MVTKVFKASLVLLVHKVFKDLQAQVFKAVQVPKDTLAILAHRGCKVCRDHRAYKD